MNGTPFFQKLVNFVLLRIRFFVNDGVSTLQSHPHFMTKVVVNKGASFTLGKNSSIQPFTVVNVGKKVEIGDDVMIGTNCLITDYQHNYLGKGMERRPNAQFKDCIIKEGVFIGSNSTIISSVIGKHCVIGSNSVVVNKELEDNTFFIGDSRLTHKSFRRSEIHD